jgi:hypothetical protein
MGGVAGDRYAEQPEVRSKCKLCGDSEVYTHLSKRTGKTHGIQHYLKAFEKVNVFRGDDVYLGRICRNCLKAGRLGEM